MQFARTVETHLAAANVTLDDMQKTIMDTLIHAIENSLPMPAFMKSVLTEAQWEEFRGMFAVALQWCEKMAVTMLVNYVRTLVLPAVALGL